MTESTAERLRAAVNIAAGGIVCLLDGPRMEHVLELPRVPAVPTTGSRDREGFERLYGQYVRMVHAILLGRVPRRDVDDLVQDVFLTAYAHLGQLRNPVAA